MRVALVYPRWDWVEYNGLAEPLGLLQLAACLRNAGHEVSYLDYSFCSSLDELDGQARKADLIGVAISSAAKLGRSTLVTNHLRGVNPGAVFLAGGAYPSIFPEKTMEMIAYDYVLAGEAESSIVELADALEAGRDPTGMMNLVFRESGVIRTNPRRPVPADLDALPHPARDLVDYDAYLAGGLSEFGAVTSRGCPYNCMYCKPSTDMIFGGGIRFRSAAGIVDELKELARLRNTTHLPVFFKDDSLTLHPTRWFEEFRDLLSEAGLKLKWHCASRVDSITAGKAAVMARSGCHCVSFGVESGSRRILEFYRKTTTPEQAESAFRFCREAGIEATAMVMIGCPMERDEDLAATFSLLRRIRPDDIVVYFSTAIPGRDIHDWAAENGYLLDDSDPDILDPARNRAREVLNMRLPYLSVEDVIRWKRRMERYRSWRKVTSPSNIGNWAGDMLRHPGRAFRNAGRVLRGFRGRSD